TIYGRAMPMPRLVAMYGPVGYRYSGIVHPPRRPAPRLEVVRRRVEAVAGRVFNSVLANLYRDGRDSVGWHRDSDYAHGGQPDIASVSFVASRRFELSDRAGARAPEGPACGGLLLATRDAGPRRAGGRPRAAGSGGGGGGAGVDAGPARPGGRWRLAGARGGPPRAGGPRRGGGGAGPPPRGAGPPATRPAGVPRPLVQHSG